MTQRPTRACLPNTLPFFSCQHFSSLDNTNYEREGKSLEIQSKTKTREGGQPDSNSYTIHENFIVFLLIFQNGGVYEIELYKQMDKRDASSTQWELTLKKRKR